MEVAERTELDEMKLQSNDVKRLNAYPEFKTDQGIDGVIAYLNSKVNNDDPLIYPANINSRQRKRYDEKYRNNFIVVDNEIKYEPPQHNGDVNAVKISLLVVRPEMKQAKLKALYLNIKLGMGVGINQFYYQVCRFYLNISREVTTEFLKDQGNYQIALIPRAIVNKPITASTPNERWGIDNVEKNRYLEFGVKKTSFLTIVDYYSKKVWGVPLPEGYDANANYVAFHSICARENTYPHIIQCDNGGNFKGNFQLLIEQNNALHPNQSIKIVYTNAYTPTANGLVERMNKEFRKKIRAGFLLHNDKLWSKYMDDYAENINNQRSSTTKYTPNELWRPGYHPVVYPQGQKFNALVINDHSSPAEINHTLQTRLYLQSKEQFKKAKQKFLVGDYVRIKLASFKLLPQIAAFAKIREKAKIQQKYDVVNFSLARF